MSSVIVASIGCWILGFVAALPLAIYRNFKERDWSNFHETFCSEDKHVMPLYWDYIIILLVWLPLSVMMVTYSTILCKLDRYERKAMNREHPMVVRYKSRVAKTLFIVLITFIIVRIPFTVMILIYYKDVDDNNSFAVRDKFVKCDTIIYTVKLADKWKLHYALVVCQSCFHILVFCNESDHLWIDQ